MEIGEFGLQADDRVMGARDVAGAAGADAMGARRIDARLDRFRMAAHAEIIVRAPDGHFAACRHRRRSAARSRAGNRAASRSILAKMR